MSEEATLYIDGVPLGIVDGPRFISELNGIEQWEMSVARKEFSTSLVTPVHTDPPKRPPDPERPMWVRDPATTRRTAYKPIRRVK
ncbi:hypothetical protein R3Q06_27535 [Rhodococcus erythropolis]|uniref:hypothetical protein n=1 Tax=Rhodococcus erythropolis TaxID=1833 RepID=UPI002948DEF8|nr:hypothetical protein [Rhodococcus erythropolis]MDV6277253.1 hypothetical protein [Rhodococcus erythropolis]